MVFENTVSKIMEEGHVYGHKIIRNPWRTCMKRLMTVEKAKEIYRDGRFGAPFSLTTPIVIVVI